MNTVNNKNHEAHINSYQSSDDKKDFNNTRSNHIRINRPNDNIDESLNIIKGLYKHESSFSQELHSYLTLRPESNYINYTYSVFDKNKK